MSSTDGLPERLRRFRLGLPDSQTVSNRALARLHNVGRPAGRRHWRDVAVACGLVLCGGITFAYFSPRFDAALAAAPVVGTDIQNALEAVGLSADDPRVVHAAAVSASNGVAVRAVDFYADSSRTVVVINVDSGSRPTADVLHLSDQFGNIYRFRGSVSNSDTHDSTLEFDSLGGPALQLGGRLILRIDALESPSGRRVYGDWRLSGVVVAEGAHRVAPEENITIGSSTVTWSMDRNAPRFFTSHVRIGQMTLADATSVVGRTDTDKGHPAASITLRRPDGTPAPQVLGSGRDTSAGVVFDSTWRIGDGGTYLFAVEVNGHVARRALVLGVQ